MSAWLRKQLVGATVFSIPYLCGGQLFPDTLIGDFQAAFSSY